MEPSVLRSDAFLLSQVKGIGSSSQIKQKEIPHMVVKAAQIFTD